MKNKVQLGDIATIYSGGTPSRNEPSYWGGKIPWVKTTQIQNKVINNADVDEWITEEGQKNSSTKMVSKGSILMAMYGQGKTRGQVAILGLNATINQACAAIQLKEDADRDYVFQQLLFRYNAIRRLSNSGSQENLSAGLIKEIIFPLPDLKSQKFIANILAIWDSAIEKTERLIEAKEKWLDWFRLNILTGKKRFKGFNKEWKKSRLRDVLTEHKEVSTGTEEVYSVSVHKGLVNQVEHLGRSFAAKDTSKYNLVKPGDIVYTKSPTGDFPLGIIKQSKTNKDVIVSPLYGVFTPRNMYLGNILDFYFESPVNALNYLRPIIHKGAKNTINITNKTFISNWVYLPVSEDEQKAIANALTTAREEIVLLKRLAEKYKEQKRGLMQKLLTGQWRVMVGEEKNK